MKHVIVVDDEQDMVTSVGEALRTAGYRVSGFTSAAKAQEMMAKDAPDLVMMDLHMPNVNGIELLRSVRRSFPKLPVIVCSGLSGYKNDPDIVLSNVGAFLDKPVDFERLGATVRRLIGAPEAP
mgnify:CR=1 FL=1